MSLLRKFEDSSCDDNSYDPNVESPLHLVYYGQLRDREPPQIVMSSVHALRRTRIETEAPKILAATLITKRKRLFRRQSPRLLAANL